MDKVQKEIYKTKHNTNFTAQEWARKNKNTRIGKYMSKNERYKYGGIEDISPLTKIKKHGKGITSYTTYATDMSTPTGVGKKIRVYTDANENVVKMTFARNKRKNTK